MVVVALVGIAVAVTTGGGKTYHLTAYFTRTVGLYTGNDVRILGVKVGHIDSITPDGSQVKVVMTYDGDDRVPAHAKAVIIDAVDRQRPLRPADAGLRQRTDAAGQRGSRLRPDDATTPTAPSRPRSRSSSTRSSATSTRSTRRSARTAPTRTARCRGCKISAENLKGNGTVFNQAFRDFSTAISTLSGSRGDLFDTVEQPAAVHDDARQRQRRRPGP